MSRQANITIFLCIALVILAAIFFWPRSFDPRDVKNYPPSGAKIVAFGDSLVEGVGSERGGGFIALLSERVGVPIENQGVSGDTTAAGLARLDDVLDLDPDIVLILLGGNDFLKRIPRRETETNLSAIITTLQEGGAIVVLLGVQGGVFSDGYDEMFEELSESHRAALVPNVLDGIIGTPDLMHDAIHPNDRGYQIIADRIAPILEILLASAR